ncbi:unnamed protein product [Urochloa humidicola]
MKRPAAVHAVLPLVLIVSLLSHVVVSGCSRPSTEEQPRNPASPHPVVVVLRDGEPHWHRRAAAAAETGTQTPTRPTGVEVEGADGDDAAPTVTAASASAEDNQGGIARSVHWSATSSRSPPPRSKLARRVLSGAAPVEGDERRALRDDDDAAPSAATASTRGEDQCEGGVATRSRLRNASSSRSPQLLRSKLARRVLARAAPQGEGAADSAKASCGSSDVHNGCPPHQ